MIYFDNAATTLQKPEQVIEAVVYAMRHFGNSARGTHETALGAARMLYDLRVKLARLFGCGHEERVVFTANATEALNMALDGLLHTGDHVISTDLEHNSVLRPLYRLRDERGISVDFVPADRQGNVNYADFSRLLRPNTRALVCTHASNLTGTCLDLHRLGTFARQNGVCFLVDASQTAGTTPIHMEKMGIDVLCFTGHKGLMGPQGTGGLCLREALPLRPLKVGGTGIQTYSERQPGAYPVRLESGTLNSHGLAGLSAAIDWIEQRGVERIHAQEQTLMRRFYEGVRTLKDVTLYGDFSVDRVPIVSLNLRDYDSSEVADELAEVYGIATRAGAHCAPRLHRALGTEQQGAVRFSFGWYNTKEEVDAAIAALSRMVIG